MSVKIYVEGGGDAKSLRGRCREGVSRLLARAGFEGRMPAIVACGGRNETFGSFRTALAIRRKTNDHPILLVDSEGAISIGADIWDYLKSRDPWDKPAGCQDDDIHLMVQCMESWFIADAATLARYFGRDFHEGSLPKHNQPESVEKDRIEPALKKASANCRKGAYDKGAHSFAILGECDPAILRQKAPHFDRLCKRLEELL
ncbi:MAG TPA: DUF4276 family protein [Phycisphaerae bacterium]|nr:DUF4276 family protein [Phycisphaerae bacterium]HRW54606.1 DUF4276 family protein [Phycisphaerae bacterium]